MARALLLSSTVFPCLAHADDAGEAIEDIVVTASPFRTDPDKLATIAGQVDRDEILKSGGTNLSDALASVPGVTGTGFAAGASRPVIRGFDANRVRLLEDGIGSFDVSDVGPDHGVPIDPLSATKIEVVRGAATLRYGSQAIGGVVNAINNRVPTELPEKTVSGEAAASYGTGADDREGSAMIDGRAGSLALHADGFIRRTGDYGIPGGMQPNSFFRGDGGSGGLSYFFGDDSRIGAAIVHYDAKYGIPSDSTYIDMKQTKGLFRSSFAIDAGALKTVTVDAGYAQYDHGEIDPATRTTLSTFKSTEWDSRAEALFDKIGPVTQSALGVQVQHRDFAALGEGADYLLPTTTKSAAVFGFAETPLMPSLRVQWGARVEHVDIAGTPASNARVGRGFTPVSGSVGIVGEPSNTTTLGLTLSSAARAPGQTELFARGAHDGPGTFETGDPNLKIERANSIEGTVRYQTKGVEIEGSAWGAKFKNYIYGRLTGRTCDDDGVCAADDAGALKELLYEQRNATFRGLEAKATFDLYTTTHGALKATALADYVRATLEGAGNVPRIPPYHIGGGLSWEGTAFDAGFIVKRTGAQRDVAVTETATAGFTTLDMRMAWRPAGDAPGVELAVVGRNLTDAVARNATSINKDDVVLPGRDVRFTVRATF
jgi:iron complex outermembrane receptor protein